jgi:hypothetical protein
MNKSDIKIDSSNTPCVLVAGSLIPLTLEVMNVISPSDINSEFYSSEEDFNFSVIEEQKKLNDKLNLIDSDETRQASIDSMLASISFSKNFIKNNELPSKLESVMQGYYNQVICNEKTVLSQDLISQCFDDILHEFMCKEFNADYSEDEQAMTFYTDYGCDIRSDFEQESQEKFDELELNSLVGSVESAESLELLCTALNELDQYLSDTNSQLKTNDCIDLTSLNQFDNGETEWVDGSFSCDLNNHMLYNDCAGDVAGRVGWEILPVSYFED